MPEIKLTPEEQNDLILKRDNARSIGQQMAALREQYIRMIKDGNWIWTAITLAKGKTKNPPKSFIDLDTGDINVTVRDGVASWEVEDKEVKES